MSCCALCNDCTKCASCGHCKPRPPPPSPCTHGCGGAPYFIEIVEVCPLYVTAPKYARHITIIATKSISHKNMELLRNAENNKNILCDERTLNSTELANWNEDRGIFQQSTTLPCKIISGWSCPKIGKYSHPTSCQKYITCTLCGENSVYICPNGESFDGRRCSSDWSFCNGIQQCEYDKQLLKDPWSDKSYFLCLKAKGKPLKQYRIYKRDCPYNYYFNHFEGKCFRQY